MDLGARPKIKTCPDVNIPASASQSESQYVSDETIGTLPDEILEYIFGLISPYSDLENSAMVCVRWNSCCRRVIALRRQHFHQQIVSGSLFWCHHPTEDSVNTISKRYSHCAVFYPSSCSMFVFGGCTSTSSTFNDLWELNLSSRTWRRPLSTGTYPSPKACASLVLHDHKLILFGGWTHPSLYPLHQSWKLFSELHIYHTKESRWALMSSDTEVLQPPAMAGHSATVHHQKMVVFGGLQKQRSSVGQYTVSNDIWVYDLDNGLWERQLAAGEEIPLARYGQSQVRLDDHHLLILGGCGGPNNEYTDIWLLDLTVSPCTWRRMEVRGSEHRARDIWCHPAVKVGDKVVVLGKNRSGPGVKQTGGQSQPVRRVSAPAPHHRQEAGLAVQPLHSISRRTDREMSPPPARQQIFRTSVNMDIAASQSSSSARSSLPPSTPVNSPNALIPVKVSPAHSKVFGPGANTGREDPSQAGARARQLSNSHGAGPVGLQQKNRQKMLENRQRQLASLQRMEEKIRKSARSSSGSNNSNSPGVKQSSSSSSCPHHRMTTFILDISTSISDHYVTWLPLTPASFSEAPQESILYSLVQGRTELIMFGGLQKDVNTTNTGRPQTNSSESVSNCLYYLNPPQMTI